MAGAGLGLWNGNQQYKNALSEAEQMDLDPRTVKRSEFINKNVVLSALGGAAAGAVGANALSKDSKLHDAITQKENKRLQKIGESTLLRDALDNGLDPKARVAANKAIAELGRDGQKDFKSTLLTVGMPAIAAIPTLGVLVSSLRKKGMSESQIQRAVQEHKRLHPSKG